VRDGWYENCLSNDTNPFSHKHPQMNVKIFWIVDLAPNRSGCDKRFPWMFRRIFGMGPIVPNGLKTGVGFALLRTKEITEQAVVGFLDTCQKEWMLSGSVVGQNEALVE